MQHATAAAAVGSVVPTKLHIFLPSRPLMATHPSTMRHTPLSLLLYIPLVAATAAAVHSRPLANPNRYYGRGRTSVRPSVRRWVRCRTLCRKR